MNDVNLIINGTFALLGIYLLILAFRAKYTGFVHQVLMVDRRMIWNQCRDKEMIVCIWYMAIIQAAGKKYY